MNSNYVLTDLESSQWDAYSIQEKEIDSRLLMGWAGYSFFKKLETLSEFKKSKTIHFLVGSGNNGGDGYVVAYHILSTYLNKKVILWQINSPKTPDAIYYYQRCKNLIDTLHKDKISSIQSINKIKAKKIKGIVIDAIFGTGLNKAPYEKIQNLFQIINKNKKIYRIALDIASGVFANGNIFQHTVFNAHRTITFGSYKIGHVLEPGIFYSGKVNVENIGFYPIELPNRKVVNITPKQKKIKSIRQLNSHKYTSGTLFILGGSKGMEGATVMAADAFLTLGGGLVKLFSTSTSIKKYLIKFPEFMYTTNQSISQLENLFLEALPKNNNKKVSVIIGIGLKEKLSKIFWEKLLKYKNINLILDGSILRQIYNYKNIFNKHNLNSLNLTPHFDEAKSLLNEEIYNIRISAIEISKQYKANVYFKGPGGILILPILLKKNKNMNINKKYPLKYNLYKERYFNSKNYQLATGGTGDVLCGFIANMQVRHHPQKAISKAIQIYLMASQIVIQKTKNKDFLKASDIIRKLM